MIEAPKPNDPNSLSDVFINFVEIVKILRTDCPWDSKQTNESISHLLIEEAYETLDSIQQGDDASFKKELGDILLHIVMHSVMASERGAFDMIDVINSITKKMVDRHPHVFGNTEVSGEQEVLENWERIKMKEGRKSALEGVPLALPALLRAERIQHKAARVGFDWEKKEDVWAKVEEEFLELKDELKAGDKARTEEEFGDFLFALVNAARFEEIVPESALQMCNAKFTKRFEYIEAKALEMGKQLTDMTLAEMDEIWNEAKKI